MAELRLVGRVSNISDLDRFKEIAAEAIRIVREKDPGTLQYVWYLDEAAQTCTVLETYASGAAAAAHLDNLGPILGRLTEIGEISLEAFGDVDDVSKQILDSFGATAVPFLGGIRP